MASFTLLPAVIPLNAPGITIKLTGTSTSWNSGTMFSITGAGAPSITNTDWVSHTEVILTLGATLTPGAFTVGDFGSGSDPSTATLTVLAWQLATDNDYWTLTGSTWSGPLHNDAGASTTFFTPGTNGAWVDQLSVGSSKITVNSGQLEFTGGCSSVDCLSRPTAEASGQRAEHTGLALAPA